MEVFGLFSFLAYSSSVVMLFRLFLIPARLYEWAGRWSIFQNVGDGIYRRDDVEGGERARTIMGAQGHYTRILHVPEGVVIYPPVTSL